MTLDPNTYFAKYTGCSVEESGDKKTPTFCVDLAITHAASGNDWLPINEEKRTIFLYMSDGAWPYTQKDLEALGFNGDFDKPTLSKADGIAVRCVHELYQGKTKEKWSLVRDGEREKKPLAVDQKRLLAQRWKTATASTRAPQGVPAAPPKAAAAADSAAHDPNKPPF